VRVGGLTIHAADLVHADANGVATIPLEIAADVADAATEFVAAEAILLDYLKAGTPQPHAFAEARRAMMDALAALSRRLLGRA
jgi:regulator of RNase E activity RraA